MSAKTLLEYRLKLLEDYLEDFKSQNTPVNRDFIAREIATCQPQISELKLALSLLTEEDSEIYEVIVEMPYTNCCDSGSFDKDIHRFSRRENADAFANAMKALGEKYVSINVEKVN